MKIKLLVALLIIGVMAIAAALFLVCYNSKQEEQIPLGEINTGVTKEVIPPKATGDINDAVSALIKGAEDEKNQTLGEDSESALLNMDSQAISDFGQSYNENDF